MRFFSKRKKKLLGVFLMAGIFSGFVPMTPAFAIIEGDQQGMYGGMDSSAMLQMMMMSGFGGIQIPGSTAKYMPIPGKKIKATPFCYIYPSKPEVNQSVTAVCAIKPEAGVSVKSTSPSGILGLVSGGKASPVIIQQTTVSDTDTKLTFLWSLEKKNCDSNGKNCKSPTTDTAMASLSISAYEGSSGLSSDSGVGSGSTVEQTPTGETQTKTCLSDGSACYIKTCDTNGNCTDTCEGTGCNGNTPIDSQCNVGYSLENNVCVWNPTSDGCDSGLVKNDNGICVKKEVETACEALSNSGTVCQDCVGDLCIPYNPSDCVTGTVCTTTGTTDGGSTDPTYYYDNGSGSSSLDDAATNALNDLFGDDSSSYNAPTGEWLDSDDAGGEADTLDGYLGDGADDSYGDVPDGMTADDGFYTDPGAEDGGEDGDVAYVGGSDGSNGTNGSNGSDGKSGADGSLGSLLDRYQNGASDLDALLNGDNSDLLGKIDGSNSSLADKIGALLGLDNDSNPSPTKSNNELYDISRQLLLANGMTMDDIMKGRNYDANSAFTEPKTAWDMNRITTLMKSKKLKVDSKGNAVASSNDKKKSSSTSSSSSSSGASKSSSSSGAKNASLTKDSKN